MNSIFFGPCQPLFATAVPAKNYPEKSDKRHGRKKNEGTSGGSVKYRRMGG
jgi:hypothetical protein